MNLPIFAQEPPTPEPPTPFDWGVTPLLYIGIAFIILGIITWKYKAVYDFLFILLSTIAGFFIGLLRFEYVSIGYAMMCAVAGFVTSLAIDAGIRAYFRLKKEASEPKASEH